MSAIIGVMANQMHSSERGDLSHLVAIVWDKADHTLHFVMNTWVLAAIAIGSVVFLLWKMSGQNAGLKDLEIDQAELGIGSQKYTLKPNVTDRQVAYAIWVELSTRKIGLEIDFDHDVISEIYDSWYGFFAVTRELVKSIPATKLKRDSTQKIIDSSVLILNECLRPHLTKWQARFRHWYERELRKYDEGEGDEILDPQMIQARFPKHDELVADMRKVNHSLIAYRSKMRRLVLND